MQLTLTHTRSLRPLLAIVVLLLSLGIVATVLVAASQRRQPPLPFGPARNGAIVYGQDGDLFIADELGATPRALVAGPDSDSDPVFSRQGDQIAFIRSAPDGERLMTVSSDGSDVHELSWDRGSVRRLDWSPDGSALLVSTYDQDVWEETQVVRSDGSGFETLGVGQIFFAIDAWRRSDGRHIAIKGDLDTPDDGLVTGLYLADADGSNLRRLPIGPTAKFGTLEWSPDGKHVAFVSAGYEGGDPGINIADIDEDGGLTGPRRLRLGPDSDSESSPKWSPDGSQLAVMQAHGSREQVGVASPDGSDFRIVWPDLPHLGPPRRPAPPMITCSGRPMDGLWSSRRSHSPRIRSPPG